MTQTESKEAICLLCPTWFATLTSEKEKADPSYWQFKRWAEENNYGGYWGFKPRVETVDAMAERWFAQELKQMWRY